MNTTMPPNFMNGAAKIMAEIRTRACIDDVDVEVIEAIVKDAINEYYDDGYSDGYADSYEHGYDDGYKNGYADCNDQKFY